MTILYFSSVRERLGIAGECIDLPDTVSTLGELVEWLRLRSARHELALDEGLRVRAAVDQVHASPEAPVRSAREIAFFPMMTGG
ncbi:MAG: MoaD/ThiS family protein [Bauldia sp.]|nr:MoaD/ThiS family protein [Bauldia sp.]